MFWVVSTVISVFVSSVLMLLLICFIYFSVIYAEYSVPMYNCYLCALPKYVLVLKFKKKNKCLAQ